MKNIALTLLTCTTLIACGGGGGSVSSPESTPTQLTAQNYVLATQEVMEGHSSLNSNSNFANNFVGAQINVPVSPAGFVQSKLSNLISRWGNDKPLLVGVLATNTVNCASGQLEVGYNDLAGNDYPDVGDSISIVANNCLDNGTKVNGQITLTFTKFQLSTSTNGFEASVHVVSTQFSSATGSVKSVSDGVFDMDIISKNVQDNSGAHPFVQIKMNAFILDTKTTSANLTRAYQYRNFVVDTNTYNDRISFNMKGNVNIPSLGSNTASIETISNFSSLTSSAYPTSGSALITFKDGGKIRISANGSSAALTELDLNGDGIFENVSNILWSEIP